MGMSSASTRHPIKTAQFPEPFEAFAEKKRYSEWVFYYRISPTIVPISASAVATP